MATTKIISIVNQKGGVGKTTTAVTLAHGLALKGKEVLVIDLDPQGSVCMFLGIKQEPGTMNLLLNEVNEDFANTWVKSSNRDHLWVIPGNNKTASANMVITAEGRPISLLRDVLMPFINKKLHYIIIDTGPSLGGLQERALWAADLVIIPVSTEYAALKGMRAATETLIELQKKYSWKGTLLGILPTFYAENTRMGRSSMEDLEKMFGDRVLPPIHHTTTLKEAVAFKQTIFEYDPASRPAEEYAKLVNEVLKY